MLFKPVLLDKIIAGQKTETRRRLSQYLGRGVWAHYRGQKLRYVVGNAYVIQPGRGLKHSGHILVTSSEARPLGDITPAEARREGFRTVAEFAAYWEQLYGTYNADEVVNVIRFRYDGVRECCEGIRDAGR